MEAVNLIESKYTVLQAFRNTNSHSEMIFDQKNSAPKLRSAEQEILVNVESTKVLGNSDSASTFATEITDLKKEYRCW